MLQPQTNYIICHNQNEEYRMSYTAWGNQEESSKTLLCLHGLNRNGRDWDYVARYFATSGYYVVAPDIVGRGNSDYLKNPIGYAIPYYVNDIFTLIRTLALTNIDLIGTSMGGVIGMTIASLPPYMPYIKKLILNDIGAEIELTGLTRILSYSNDQAESLTYKNIKNYIINTAHDFGNLPDEVWDHIAINSVQKNSRGMYDLKRDININKALKDMVPPQSNLLLWQSWQPINIPILVIRGEYSDILSMNTVNKMQLLKPQMKFIEIKHTGHAPYLYTTEHFTILEQFLTYTRHLS